MYLFLSNQVGKPLGHIQQVERGDSVTTRRLLAELVTLPQYIQYLTQIDFCWLTGDFLSCMLQNDILLIP